VDPNADSKAIAILFRQSNFSGKDFQHAIMFVWVFSIVSSDFRKSTNFDTHSKDALKSISCFDKSKSIQKQISPSLLLSGLMRKEDNEPKC